MKNNPWYWWPRLLGVEYSKCSLEQKLITLMLSIAMPVGIAIIVTMILDFINVI